MKKIADLTAADFPDIDANKFEEWKRENKRFGINIIMWNIPVYALFILGYMKVIYFGAIEWLMLAVALIVVPIFATRKYRSISKELNITNKKIRAALKR